MDMNPEQQTQAKLELTDLNIDCLEHVFFYLGADDLVNVADTNKLMKKAAELAFTGKFRNKLVYINPKISTKKFCGSKCWASELSIMLRDIKTCFGFLRCFGHLITKMDLSYFEIRRNWELLPFFDQYVTEYCADFLTEIDIRWNCCTLKGLNKPFPMVEKIRFLDATLDGQLTRFNYLFPKMRSLDFIRTSTGRFSTEIENPECIAHHFPNLEHLSISISPCEPNKFTEEHVLAAVRLNPQLRSLSLHSKFSENIRPVFLQELGQLTNCLESLELALDDDMRTYYKNEMIHFKDVKNFTLFVRTRNLSRLPFTFDALETFALEEIGVNEVVVDFLKRNPSIAKFKANYVCTDLFTADERYNISMAESFAFIKELDFTRVRLSVDEAIFFLDTCRSLEKFTFGLHDSSHCDRFKELMESRRNISLDIIKFDRVIYHKLE